MFISSGGPWPDLPPPMDPPLGVYRETIVQSSKQIMEQVYKSGLWVRVKFKSGSVFQREALLVEPLLFKIVFIPKV